MSLRVCAVMCMDICVYNSIQKLLRYVNKCRFLLSEIMSLKEDGLQKEQKSNRESFFFFNIIP